MLLNAQDGPPLAWWATAGRCQLARAVTNRVPAAQQSSAAAARMSAAAADPPGFRAHDRNRGSVAASSAGAGTAGRSSGVEGPAVMEALVNREMPADRRLNRRQAAPSAGPNGGRICRAAAAAHSVIASDI